MSTKADFDLKTSDEKHPTDQTKENLQNSDHNQNNILIKSNNEIDAIDNNYSNNNYDNISNNSINYPSNLPNNNGNKDFSIYPSNYSNNELKNYPNNYPNNNENNSTDDEDESDFSKDTDIIKSKIPSKNKDKISKKHFYPKLNPIITEDPSKISTDSKLINTETETSEDEDIKIHPSTDPSIPEPPIDFPQEKTPDKSDHPPNIDSNFEKSKIEKFKQLLNNNDRECSIFIFNPDHYEKVKNENGFIYFERSFKLPIEADKPLNSMRIVSRVSSLTSRTTSPIDSLISRSMSADVYRKNINFEAKVKLGQMKQFFLTHSYKEVPHEFNDQLFIDQVTCYMKNQNNSLAHFQGFSITDFEGHFLPTVLTERPVNGPLSSLFPTVKKNLTKIRLHDKRRSFGSFETFNIEKLDTVTAEQKFSMIIGIIHGIAFIHDCNFIHSNLNPTTVYLNENLQPQLCDYVFIPPFKVETVQNEEKNSDDKNDGHKFEYTISGEESRELFKDNVYISPEILRGGKFDRSIDIYSVGQIIYFILFEEDRQQTNKDESNVNSKSKCISTIWDELIRSCIQEDASQRPSAEDLLNILLDEEKMPQFISSITPNASPTPTISEKTEIYIKLIRENLHKEFNDELIDIDIFHTMIPNVIGIDEDTRLIISAAEKGDIESIEKVGDFFFEGTNNFHRDEGWSYSCYKEAADRGSLYSMKKVAQFKEEGIGTDADLNDSYDYYSKALKKMSPEDPERSKIESKMIELDNKRRTIVLKNVPLKKSISGMKIFFRGINIDSIYSQKVNEKIQNMTITFHTKSDLDSAKKVIREKRKVQRYDYELLDQKQIQSHRFDSLSSNLPLIHLDDYYPGQNNEKFTSLGRGSFAETFLVYKKVTEEPFAAKVFIHEITDEQINSLKREIIIASKFDHPSILKYVGFSEFSLTENYNKINSGNFKPTLLLSYIPNGTLKKFIVSKSSKWNDTSKLKVILGIASGLSEMYANNVIHRDLKPENILITENMEPVICDLGCSRQYSPIDYLRMSDNVGTPIYMAPELFNYDYSPVYRYEVDSYSFGIILFQILTATPHGRVYPSDATNKIIIRKYKMNNYMPKIPEKINHVFKYLIKTCWNISVDERPSPPTIYALLLDAIDNGENLLPNADMDAVREYIGRLPGL